MKRGRLLVLLVLGTLLACDSSPADGMDETSGGSGSSSGSSTGGESELPSNSYCDPILDWGSERETLEAEVLLLVNQNRAAGANCGSEGSFPAVPALSAHGALTCAARVHSKDMVDRDYFDHTNPDGLLPWDRMDLAGYDWSAAGENIAAGNATAAATVQQWMDSDGHCVNIMSGEFEEIGVGYYPGGEFGHVWTQVFGR